MSFNSAIENPVSSDIPTAFISFNKSANFSSSHSPDILFKAIFKAFSSSLLKSTTTHSTSWYPKSFNTFILWCPPITVMSELIITGSMYPKCSMLLFIFSYSSSPACKSFLGLYVAGINFSILIFCIFNFYIPPSLILRNIFRDCPCRSPFALVKFQGVGVSFYLLCLLLWQL